MVCTVDIGDIQVIRSQLSREPRGVRSVASRCGFGCPQVIETDAFIADGKPFPTLYWLSCPHKIKAISRLEDEGWEDRLRREIMADPSLQKRLQLAQEDYRARRRRAHPGAAHPVFATGIGGVRDLATVKCLHAHYAHFLAGGPNPIGERVHQQLVSLEIERECRGRCDRP